MQKNLSTRHKSNHTIPRSMGKLFGTNGVRGVFGKEFTLEFVHDLTLSLAVYFKNGPILIGYDGRESSV